MSALSWRNASAASLSVDDAVIAMSQCPSGPWARSTESRNVRVLALMRRLLDEVGVRAAGRHDRPHVRVALDAQVEDGRAGMAARRLERGDEFVALLDARAEDAVGLRDLHVVGARDRRLRDPAVEEQLLPLPDHAEIAVVHDRELHGQTLLDRRAELLQRHLHAAVAGDGPDLAVAVRVLAAQ